MFRFVLLFLLIISFNSSAEENSKIFFEDWGSAKIDSLKWYSPRKKWGNGNNGVIPENLKFEKDTVFGKEKTVLSFYGNGDAYTGSLSGLNGNKARVGSMLVSKRFFASGVYEIVFKIGDSEKGKPVGMIPAIWTYAYRFVKHSEDKYKKFDSKNPAYHPVLDKHKWGGCEYWSEIDFPEFGKNQELNKALFNTFMNANFHSQIIPTPTVTDGKYHTMKMTWQTELIPIEITDSQVAEDGGLWWVQDEKVKFENYRGNPLKRLGKDKYSVYAGKEVLYELDGKVIGRSTSFIPAMAAQLNLGVWFPEWGGKAPWERAKMSISSVKITPLNNSGDCFGFLVDDLKDNFDKSGNKK